MRYEQLPIFGAALLRPLARCVLATAVAALALGGRAEAQSTSTWANSNITATPPSLLDWFTGGPNTQGTWQGGDPVSGNANSIQFFENTTTALTNTVAATQTVDLNNGGSAFQLGTLTLSGLASETTNADLTMNLSGDALNFSGATGTINLNALNNTRTITYNVNNAIRLGTAGSGSVLTIGGAGTGNFVIGGIISELQAGGGSLTKSGASTVTLAGANSYTGTTRLSAGRLNLNSASAIGTGPLVIAGGTLGNTSGGAITLSTNNAQTWSGNFTFAGTSDLNLGTGAVALGANRTVTVSANTLTVGGAISGAFTLTKAGAGTLSLDGDNTYSGRTTVSAGRLNINSATAIGTGEFLISSGATLGNTSGGAITLSTNNVVNWNSNFTFAGPYDLNLGTGALVSFGTSGRTANVLAGTLTIDGVISGSGPITKQGAGTLSFGGANTRTGSTTVNGGTLVLNYGTQDNSKLSDTASLTLGGGAVVLKGGSHTETVASTTMSIGASVISRDGGSSVLQLNAITRGTDVKGSLAFGAGSIATTDTLNTNGILGAWATIGNDWAINSTNAADGAITALASYDGALPTATGSSTANYTLTGNQTQSGAVAANTVKITNTGNSETLNLGGNDLTITAASSQTAGGIMYAGGADGNYTIDSTGGRIVASASREVIFQIMSGTLTVNAAVWAGVNNPYYTKYGAGTLVVGASNNFTATIDVIEGVLRFTNAQAQGQATNRNMVRVGAALELANDISVAAKPLDLFGSGISSAGALRNFSGSNTYAGAITIGSGGASITSDAGGLLTLSGGVVTASGNNATFGGAGDITVGGGISGAGEVIKEGAGALTLGGAGHAGAFRINAGQLNVNAANALGSAASLSLAAGVTLDNTSATAVTVNNATLATTLGSSLTFLGTQDLSLGTGPTTLTATSAIDVQAGTLTFGGNVVDGGSGYGITKDGPGTLVLSGLTSGAFSGNSVLNAGELFLSGTSTLGGTSANTITVNPGSTLRIGGTASTGGVTVNNAGGTVIVQSLQPSGQTFSANTSLTADDALFNGVQKIDAGVVVSASQDWLGSDPGTPTAGRIVMENGATLRSTNAINIDADKGIELAGASATFDADTGTIFINSQVTGTGKLVKTGTDGFRILNTSNSYAGGTEILEGTFGIYGDGSLGAAGTQVLIDGATLNSGQGTSGQTITVSSARSIVLGNGKTSNLDATNGSTLAYAGVITEVDGGGAAATLRIGTNPNRLGTVLLGGANTYRGDTIINAGSLKLASAGSFANSPRIIVGDATGSAAATLDLTEKTAFLIDSTQTLMGKGRVLLGAGTELTVAGLFSPGNSPGLFTYDGGSTTLSGTTLMEVWGTSRGTNPGYDAVNVINSGLLTLGGTLELDFNQNFPDTTSFTLFDTLTSGSLAGGFTGITITGSNNSYVGLSFTQAGNVWTTGFNGNNQGLRLTQTASNVTLDVIVVPEPGSIVLAGLGLAAAAFAYRRRKGL